MQSDERVEGEEEHLKQGGGEKGRLNQGGEGSFKSQVIQFIF